MRYQLDKALIREASENLDTEAERIGDLILANPMQDQRIKRRQEERRSKLWDAAHRLRLILRDQA